MSVLLVFKDLNKAFLENIERIALYYKNFLQDFAEVGTTTKQNFWVIEKVHMMQFCPVELKESVLFF